MVVSGASRSAEQPRLRSKAQARASSATACSSGPAAPPSPLLGLTAAVGLAMVALALQPGLAADRRQPDPAACRRARVGRRRDVAERESRRRMAVRSARPARRRSVAPRETRAGRPRRPPADAPRLAPSSATRRPPAPAPASAGGGSHGPRAPAAGDRPVAAGSTGAAPGASARASPTPASAPRPTPDSAAPSRTSRPPPEATSRPKRPPVESSVPPWSNGQGHAYGRDDGKRRQRLDRPRRADGARCTADGHAHGARLAPGTLGAARAGI